MGARLLQIGSDYSNHHLVLQSAGYEVRPCGPSLAGLEEELENWKPDAVLVVDDTHAPLTKNLLPVVRKHTSAPVIVLGTSEVELEPGEVQLVVPPLTNPSTWLPQIAKILQASQEVREAWRLLRERSAELRKQTAELREDTVREIESLEEHLNRTKNKKN